VLQKPLEMNPHSSVVTKVRTLRGPSIGCAVCEPQLVSAISHGDNHDGALTAGLYCTVRFEGHCENGSRRRKG
jgi:hypothetical protein